MRFIAGETTEKANAVQHSSRLIREWAAAFEKEPDSSPFNVFGLLFRHYHDHAAFYTMLLRQNMSWVILDTIKEKTGMVAE